jgi:thiol:disulfide interchange protein
VVKAQAGDWREGQPLWPPDHPHEANLGDKKVINYVYTGRVIVYVPLAVPVAAPAGPHRITFTLEGQLCSEKEFQCLNVRQECSADVTVGPDTVANAAWEGDISAALQQARPAEQLRPASGEMGFGEGMETPGSLSVWGGLGLALLAGLILNIMPCVLPVIPIRILSVVELARQSRRRFITVGLAFAGGILLFFVILAAANVVLHLASGTSLNWGRQFQSSPFRIGMAMLMVALAANLFGAFTVLVPRRIAVLEGQRNGQGHLASMGMGLMMAVLATPCSFAILVVAFAWARLQPLWLGSLAIMLIGVGMAAPHALLATAPRLLGFLPRPGRWMELLKQSMGFVLLLVAAWLIGTLSPDAYPLRVAAYGVVLAFCLWMWGSWVGYDWPAGRKVIFRAAAAALAIVAGWWLLQMPKPLAVEFSPYSDAALASARQEGKTVLVDFTAAWCLSCKIVDATIYDNPEVATDLKSRQVLALRADVTTADAPANRLLYEQLKGAPPLTVIYPPAGVPIHLEGKFTRADLFAALDKAAGKTKQ